MNILSELKKEASKLEQRLDTLNSAIKALDGRNSVGRPNGRRKKRHMSASARARIAKGSVEQRDKEVVSAPMRVEFSRGREGFMRQR